MLPYGERVAELRSAIDAALDALRSQLSDEDRASYAEQLNQLERALTFGSVSVEASDPDLVSSAAHTSLKAGADRIAADVASAVRVVEAYADPLIDAAMLLPAARGRDFEQVARDAATKFQTSVAEKLSELETAFDNTKDDLEALRTSVTEATTELQGQIESRNQTFQTELDGFAQTLASHQTAVSEQLTRQTTEFNSSQEDRSKAFTTAEEERAARIRQEIEGFQRQLEETRQQSAKELETHLEEIRRLAGEAKNLNYAMSLSATAMHYGTEAETEKKAADRLRTGTIALALAAAAVAFFAVFHQTDETRALVAKLAVSAILGGLATYTARQSGRHRSRASRARSLQLELIAFSPFIEPLHADQKEEERVILTRKTFTGGVWSDHSDFQDPGPSAVSLLMRRRLQGRGQEQTEGPGGDA